MGFSRSHAQQSPERAGAIINRLRNESGMSFVQDNFRFPVSGSRNKVKEVPDRVRDDAPRQFPVSVLCPLSSVLCHPTNDY